MKVKVSIVSYSNTLPFLYGLYKSSVLDEMDLSLDIPSKCAEKLLSDTVDIGLVPIAIIPQLKESYIITDYCIGADKKVNSVIMVSDVPLEEIEEVVLDYQSKTSINLVQILARNYWKINPKFIHATQGFEDKIENKLAAVIIGDRTFSLPKRYKYVYDLAEEWHKFTGLQFAFACWVANKPIDKVFVNKLNEALKYGVKHIEQSVELSSNHLITPSQLQNYLLNDISYSLTDEKQKSIELFFEYLSENVNI